MHIGNIEVKEGESVLAAIRQKLGLSQEGLARKLGVSLRTVARWEHGDNPANLTISQIKALSKELRSIGLTVEDLPDDLGPLTEQN